MKTQGDIVEYIERIKSSDWLGTIRTDLMLQLDFDHAKPYMKDDVTRDQWSDERPDPRAEAVGYLDFAFDKCLNHRGISASRSLDHFHAWFWLMGDDEMVRFITDEQNYAQYGAPVLLRIAQKLDVQPPTELNFVLMSEGRPCTDMENGCGCGQ